MLRCPVCGRGRIAIQWLCRSCQEKYGDYNEWPRWLRILVSMQRRFDGQIGGITGIPTTFIIDRKGDITDKFVGYRSLKDFEKAISPHL